MSGLLAPVRPVFRAVAQAMVPAAERYDESAWRAMEATVEGALTPRPMAMQKQFVTFLRLANVLAVPLSGRTLVGLPVRERERVLHALERAPVALVRRGVWGVRTLVFMGHYAGGGGKQIPPLRRASHGSGRDDGVGGASHGSGRDDGVVST